MRACHELFKLRESCGEEDTKRSFRKLIRSDPPANPPECQFEELVRNEYNHLRDNKLAYDEFLKISKFLYINELINYKNYFVVTAVGFVCLFAFIDFIVCAVIYLKFIESIEILEKLKKEEKKPEAKYMKKALQNTQPTMLSK